PAPAPPPAASDAEPRIHVVRRGDTLWSLSRRYYGRASHENVRRIVRANPDLEADHIRIGQEIVIPE
ncbi:MAG: LysM peptidoglycan-binding domain-containing protein, partial [Planctomycetota bacterium]